MTTGCAKNLSIKENLFSNQYKNPKYSGKMLLKQKEIEKRSDELIKEYLIKCRSRKQNVGMLSGGNIQKVIVAREFSTAPDIIIANQPTRGIDVGAKYEIYEIMNRLVEQGVSIIMITSELPELLSMSDRIIVMREGYITGELDYTEATEESVMNLATKEIAVR